MKDPVPIVREAGWAVGPVWTGAENFAPTGIRFPDRPTFSQSLYRLRYPAHPAPSGLPIMIPVITLSRTEENFSIYSAVCFSL